MKAVARRFSRAAATYDRSAVVQKQSARQLVSLLSTTLASIPAAAASSRAQRVLEVGCGSGQLTELLVATLPNAEIEAIDVAPRMVELARRRDELREVQFSIQDVREFKTTKPFDLIISNSTLQWISPLHDALAPLAASLLARGRLYFAVMLRGTLEELIAIRNEVAPHKARRELPTAADVAAALAKCGLKLLSTNSEVFSSAHADVQQLFESLREQGVTAPAARETLLTRSELRQLGALYQSRYQTVNITANFEVGYFVAERC